LPNEKENWAWKILLAAPENVSNARAGECRKGGIRRFLGGERGDYFPPDRGKAGMPEKKPDDLQNERTQGGAEL